MLNFIYIRIELKLLPKLRGVELELRLWTSRLGRRLDYITDTVSHYIQGRHLRGPKKSIYPQEWTICWDKHAVSSKAKLGYV